MVVQISILPLSHDYALCYQAYCSVPNSCSLASGEQSDDLSVLTSLQFSRLVWIDGDATLPNSRTLFRIGALAFLARALLSAL